MCGHFTHRIQGLPALEWNVVGDPHATKIVYNAAIPIHRSVGLDVTSQITMSSKQFKKEFQFDIFRPILDFADVWFEHSDIITFHDPLAATTIFNDRICTFEKGLVDVELNEKKSIGLTYWKPGNLTAQHEVALEVDRELFFKHYFSYFK